MYYVPASVTSWIGLGLGLGTLRGQRQLSSIPAVQSALHALVRQGRLAAQCMTRSRNPAQHT
eukprot:8660192-Lingulodinium_polyedra.AAC.1